MLFWQKWLHRWGQKVSQKVSTGKSGAAVKKNRNDAERTYEEFEREDQFTAAHKFGDLVDNLSHDGSGENSGP